VPKTSSGKVRRSACQQRYQAGQLLERRAVWRQVARLALTSLPTRLGLLARGAGRVAYAAWAWLVFGLVAVPALLGGLLLPGVRLRRGWGRGAIRLLALAAATPLRREGRLPAGPALYVANHDSYLDPLALAALLPPDAAFAVADEAPACVAPGRAPADEELDRDVPPAEVVGPVDDGPTPRATVPTTRSARSAPRPSGVAPGTAALGPMPGV